MSGSISESIVLITGTSRGIGEYLATRYLEAGCRVIGCSRSKVSLDSKNYTHFCLDITDEAAVKTLFTSIRKQYKHIDILVNNAGIASLNHSLLTPMDTVSKVFSTNVFASFLFCREAAKLMRKNKFGRIVNFTTVAVPFNLEGEAIYAASKSAVESLTKVLAREFADFGITVNAVGPTPIDTNLIKNVPSEKISELVSRQAIKRKGTAADVKNVVDFFINDTSDFITGQVVYLGGV
ncbi:MAG: SDR family oxidoreductase [Alteromonadaceae bacterium]|nr:SDR family oxidoreductase [Alteromonadaceae bacterium]